LYRYVGNDPVNKTDPSGLEEYKNLHPSTLLVVNRCVDQALAGLYPNRNYLNSKETLDEQVHDAQETVRKDAVWIEALQTKDETKAIAMLKSIRHLPLPSEDRRPGLIASAREYIPKHKEKLAEILAFKDKYDQNHAIIDYYSQNTD